MARSGVYKAFGGDLNVKRFHMPGVRYITQCPRCGEFVEKNFEDSDYLNYPIVGEFFELGFYCHECGQEWALEAKLDVTLTIQDPKFGEEDNEN